MNYYNEFEAKTATWLRQLIKDKLIPNGHVDERSITDVSPDDLSGYTQCHFFAGIGGWSKALQIVGWPDDRPVWTGSCPCQPYSSSGRNLGNDDERNLWPHFFRLIKKCRPQHVFGEQVENAVGHQWLDMVHSDLEEEGYTVGATVLGAHSVGADHERQRIYWAANAPSLGQQEPWKLGQDAYCGSTGCFREADRLVLSVRRGDLPFLCREHDGLPILMDRLAGHALGNAIVPQVAAEFISAYLECLTD
jgi:DNA (cytosine-5)-methyltransferase 1